jgi:hypothetical protein
MVAAWMNPFAALCALVVSLCGESAVARPVSASQAPLASDFDLSRQASSDDGARYRVRREGEGRRYAKDKLGPYITYNPISGGPTFEFGALGAGRKGTPGLAHVGVDWNF